MTINAPAALLLAPLRARRREAGRVRRSAARHRAERHPQGVRRARELHLPAAARRCGSRPTCSPTATSGCRAGTRSRSPATTSARRARRPSRSSRSRSRTGSRTCEAAVAAGLSPDEFGERLSFFFNAHNDFFQEVAKFRAARTLWARIMRDRFGATNPKAQALRFHAQTGGSTLTAQQPENNIVRVAVQALSAVCGGAQSLHTNGFDEALALPTEQCGADRAPHAADPRRTRRAATDTADPLGGSYFVEALTRELEERAPGADRADRRARRRGRGDRAGLRAGGDRGVRLRRRTQVEAGERVDRRGQRVRRGRRREPRSSFIASIPRSRRARSSEPGACGPSGTATLPMPALAACARLRGATANLLLPMREALAAHAPSARSAARYATRSARTTPPRAVSSRTARSCFAHGWRSRRRPCPRRRDRRRSRVLRPLDAHPLSVQRGRRARVSRLGTSPSSPSSTARPGRLLGGIGARAQEPAIVEIGYWVKAEARGRGVATRALVLIARFAFDELGAAPASSYGPSPTTPARSVSPRRQASAAKASCARSWTSRAGGGTRSCPRLLPEDLDTSPEGAGRRPPSAATVTRKAPPVLRGMCTIPSQPE